MANKKTNGEIKRRPLCKGEVFSCTNICTSMADITKGLKGNCTKILNYVESKMIESPYTVIKAFPTVLKRVIKSFSKKKIDFKGKGNQLKLIINNLRKTNTRSEKSKSTKPKKRDNGRTK